MDEALDLSTYLPVSYKAQSESDYVEFLWSAFDSNYTSGKYEFASLAFHLLYMSFVSFSIWQIRLAREKDFQNALIGFQSETEMNLLAADTPFKFYERLREAQIFRFLKVIGCGNEQVGEFSKFVRRRNKIAHPSGTVFFNDQRTIDDEIADMMREVSNIQTHMRPIILDVYGSFLKESANPEEREYGTAREEIEANFIHRSYVSQKDIVFCLGYDLTPFAANPNYANIQDLHQSLQDEFADA
ncbi:MAG: hypothetical protein FJY56_07825 [Betaproteobacteria bacterium]|nr:hypothetical protein [Betaproteobacteria bacterium]